MFGRFFGWASLSSLGWRCAISCEDNVNRRAAQKWVNKSSDSCGGVSVSLVKWATAPAGGTVGDKMT